MTLPPSLGWSLIRGASAPVWADTLRRSGRRSWPPTCGIRDHGCAAVDVPRLLSPAWVAKSGPNVRFCGV